MRKFWILLLTVLLLATLCGAAYTDRAKIDPAYGAAVDALSKEGLLTGFEDGTFRPESGLTRAQAAKLLFSLLEGGGTPRVDPQPIFSDVAVNHWAAPYIRYCAEKQIVAGVGRNAYLPQGTLTGTAFGKMLLAAWGLDPQSYGLVGESWATNTLEQLSRLELDTGVAVCGEPISRQEACQLVWNYRCRSAMEGNTPLTLSLSGGAARPLGSASCGTEGVICRHPGDGAELILTCGGDLHLTYEAEAPVTITVVPDGGNAPVHCTGEPGTHTLLLLQGLPRETHTLRILLDSAGKTGAVLCSLQGALDPRTATPTEEGDTELLFVGGDAAFGIGVLGDPGSAWTPDLHSAWAGYACCTARSLQANCTLLTAEDVLAEALPDRSPEVVIVDPDARGKDGARQLCEILRDRYPEASILLLTWSAREPAAEELAAALGGAEAGIYGYTAHLGGGGGIRGGVTMAGEAESLAFSAGLATCLRTLL